MFCQRNLSNKREIFQIDSDCPAVWLHYLNLIDDQLGPAGQKQQCMSDLFSSAQNSIEMAGRGAQLPAAARRGSTPRAALLSSMINNNLLHCNAYLGSNAFRLHKLLLITCRTIMLQTYHILIFEFGSIYAIGNMLYHIVIS